LSYLNRAHTADHAKQCIKQAQDCGFSNISIDLIYAIPSTDHHIWESDLQTTLQLNVQHISAYCLTIEPQTAFGKWLQKGKLKPINEEFSIQQFTQLIDVLENNGFEQYEISNFAVPGYHSRHNTGYWKKQTYLGVGPSAHSYNGKTRQYNIANNNQYIRSIEGNSIPCITETLSEADQVNEYIMTSLRTKWGCNLQEIIQFSGIDIKKLNKDYLQKCLQQKLIKIDNEVIKLTFKGKLLADKIASDLFVI
jgi:oxygen-independent coproporphyrinogen-3 oxidase